MTPAENLKALQGLARYHAVDLVSSARVDPGHREQFHPSIRGVSEPLDYAVVIGIRLSQPVLDTVTVAPTWTYYHHYRMVNFALDQAALVIAGACRRNGYRAFPVPASQILDWNRLRGHLSHRAMGEMAGLGWRGRNNLLVNPRFGSMVRYVTVLTDMPLPHRGAGEDVTGCDSCRACIAVCPAGAIHDDAAAFELDRCAAQLRRFAHEEKLNTMICGLCVRVCRGCSTEASARRDC
ncbi:MAG TPA: reductive dehalogenase domain-containing protein [Patescibacteria group bacterium]|nr:reductive dehalogenase domain-containing protein [Patescibacteria group bacterium]